MKRKYTRKQILESIKYWKKQLKTGNYRKLNESKQLNEGKIADFFGKLFKTKKFLAKQAELEKAAQEKADAEFAKKHPLAEVAQKMDNESANYICRFTNADVENDGYPRDMSAKMDCIAVRIYGVDTVGVDRVHIDIEDDKDAIMKLFKQCGGPDNCEFYVINGLMGIIMPKISEEVFINKVNESEGGEFEEIDDIVKFCKDKNVKWKEIYKTSPIKILRKAKKGEIIRTVASDGTDEAKQEVKGDDSWVVCNVTNEDNFWPVREKVIKKDYLKKDAENAKEGEITEVKAGDVYRPKTKSEGGEGRLYAPIADYCDKGVHFAPPNWYGDEIDVKNNGYFMKVPGDEKDIYGISIVDFDTTYKQN